MAKKNNKKHQRVKSTFIDDSSKFLPYTLAAVILTTIVIYFKAINFDFIFNWDDQTYIIDNPDIKNLGFKNIKLFFINFYNSNYQPLTMLVYAIEYKLGNGSASVFHLFNILLHLLNTFFVFKLINNCYPKNAIVALITAALFSVHPMHVESVAWVSELKDVLYTFFFLISLLFYTHFLKTNNYKHLGSVAVFFLLSCLSKSAAVILPLVLLVIDYYNNRKLSWGTVMEKLPFFAVSFIFGLIAIQSQKGAIHEMAPTMTFVEHVALVSFSFCSYIFKAVFPFNLFALYPYPLELGNTLPVIYYSSIVFLIALFIAVWFSQKWGKDVLFGFSFFIITIVLVIQIVPVGAASMADRYTYVPYIGLFFMVGKLFEYLQNKYPLHKNGLLLIFAVCFISYAATSYSRVGVWKNDNTLFSDVINKCPYCGIAYLNRGTYFYNNLAPSTTNVSEKNSFIQNASVDFENAVKCPLSDVNKSRAYLGLGMTNSGLNNFDKAVEYLTKSIETDSTFRGNALLERGNIYLNQYAGKIFLNDTVKRNDYMQTMTLQKS